MDMAVDQDDWATFFFHSNLGLNLYPNPGSPVIKRVV